MGDLPVPTGGMVVALGILTLTTLVFQMLVGFRKIKFKGRTHLKVHKTVAWVMLGLALIHGFAAAVYMGVGPF